METIKNVLVGQSGGPTAVINASLAGVYETARAMGAPRSSSSTTVTRIPSLPRKNLRKSATVTVSALNR